MSDTLTLNSNRAPQTWKLSEHNEGYFELVWRRFRRSRPHCGRLMVIMLGFLAIFAEFFRPTRLSGSILMMLLSRRSASICRCRREFPPDSLVYNFDL
jgi:hypothetical protein